MKQDVTSSCDGENHSYELRQVIEYLENVRVSGPNVDDMPSDLPLTEVSQHPQLFQPRNGQLDERHVQVLKKTLQNHGELDPVEVIKVGRETYVIDGHHRLEAYHLEGRRKRIPVVYFKGSIAEAVLKAGQSNTKDKLPMTNQEKQDFAWRLVRLGKYTKKAIAEAASISERQVTYMRKALKQLGDEAYEIEHWWQVRERTNGKDFHIMSDEERAEWLEQEGAKITERLGKTFGKQLSKNLEVTALGFAEYFGLQLPELVNFLQSHSEDYDDDIVEADCF